MNLYEYQQLRRRQNKRREKKYRKHQRLMCRPYYRAVFYSLHAKPGVQPLSVLHPDHPIRQAGPESAHYRNRDRNLWA